MQVLQRPKKAPIITQRFLTGLQKDLTMFSNCKRLEIASVNIYCNGYALVLRRKLVPVETSHQVS